jgi:hypothetical protein
MQFFSNKIYVDGGSKSFSDIINDVKGGMVKTASKKKDDHDSKESMMKTNKEETGDKAHKGSVKDGGLTPAQKKLPPALRNAIAKKNKGKKSKKADSDSTLKIAAIDKVSDDEVVLTLAQHVESMESIADSEEDEGYEVVIDGEGKEDSPEGASESKDVEAKSCGDMTMAGSEKESCWKMKGASEGQNFVKIANLTEKQKGNFRKYWENVWPKEFIDAVLSTEN